MTRMIRLFKSLALSGFLALTAAPSFADRQLERLYDRLSDPETSNWREVEQEIWSRWAQSGSATADLLLQRGREALEAGEMREAIEHLTAAIDHAPDFAEAYNARATAYYEQGLYGPSMFDIEATLRLNPRHFGAMMGLGSILEQIGAERDALSVYRAVELVHPHRDSLHEALERLQTTLDAKPI